MVHIPLGLRLQGNSELTISSLVRSWIQCDDNNYSFSLGASICWAIWKARNKKVFENKNINVQGILKIAFYWFNLYFNPHDDSESGFLPQHRTQDPSPPATWSAPSTPFIKINVDASWKNGVYACAAIARDHMNVCRGAGTRIGMCEVPVFAEADGFLLAAELTIWLNLQEIIIEGDSQIVVKSLTDANYRVPWRIWKLKDDTKLLLAGIKSSTVKYIPEKANSAAHSLADYAYLNKVQAMWTSSNLPSDIASLWIEAT
ncbi:uncharacterized protein LOC113311958 [Papaver somniferum]|uniref:uncharacterized protein LOC113311958 n=1 Tax=Papaver somniferum TaxID=3469 RepID=UPI000E6F4FB6|nr:uncharacterized protein LOC113311958 [Papaver somniferum]